MTARSCPGQMEPAAQQASASVQERYREFDQLELLAAWRRAWALVPRLSTLALRAARSRALPILALESEQLGRCVAGVIPEFVQLGQIASPRVRKGESR